MLVCVRSLGSGELLTEVVVEPENSVAFLKHRIWEAATLPRCGQALYNGDTELEDEYTLEDYEMQPEHTIDYSAAWHEPFCPGCSDCERNFCSACALYPINRGRLWPEPRPYCSVCNHGHAPAEEAAAALSDATDTTDTTEDSMNSEGSDVSSTEHSHITEGSDLLESDMPEVPEPADTTAQPYESFSAPADQLVIARDVMMNQPEFAGTHPYLFATDTAASLPVRTSNQSDTAQDNQTGDRMVAPDSMATQPASAQHMPTPLSLLADDGRVVSFDEFPPPRIAQRTSTTTAAGASRASGQGARSSQPANRSPISRISQLRSSLGAIQSQLDNLEVQMENMARDSRCCICLTGNHDSQLLPCMHNKFCKACLEQHLSRDYHCPICRVAVRGMLTSFGG